MPRVCPLNPIVDRVVYLEDFGDLIFSVNFEGYDGVFYLRRATRNR